MTVDEAKQRIEDLKTQINDLQKEEHELESFVAEIALQERVKAYMEEIHSINDENSKTIRLYHNTKTTPIMDNFYFSSDRFLIIYNVFHAYGPWCRISLIVRKDIVSSMGVQDSGLTMTDVKKLAGGAIGEEYLWKYESNDRVLPLIEQILKLMKQSDVTGAISFEKPIRLGGQKYSNQTGYGSRYYGEWMVEQGTLYGETTSFYIVGILIEK